MKKYYLWLCMFLFGFTIQAQDTKIESLRIEAGIQIPLGNLASKYQLAQELGIYYRTMLPFEDVLDVGVKFYVPNDKNDFTYFSKDSTYNTKVKNLNLTILGKVTKHYNVNLLHNSFVLEWTSGFGFNFLLFTDKERINAKPTWETDEDGDLVYNLNSDVKSLTTVYLLQGVGISIKKFGISAHYNFTPYNWFSKRIDRNFGSSCLSFLITYKI